MKRTVLFVDDEPLVLEGLRTRLRRLRNQWDMVFVSSGQAALDAMSTTPVDVIVSDLRMPHMDGAALLKRVQEEHPRVVRIVLSGHAEMQTALRAMPVAHQFLSKPAEPGVIEEVIERACNLQTLIGDERVRKTVSRIGYLPSAPGVYSEFVALMSRENVSSSNVAALLKRDIALSAKTLQVVNSAFFRLSRPVADVEEAVTYLGLNTVKYIVLAIEVYQRTHSSAQPLGVSLERLQRHALGVAHVASSFFSDKATREDAFVAGLLHDIGKLVLAVGLPEHLERAEAEATRTGCSLHHAEQEIWGVTHAEVGGYLLGIWGLPYPIMEAVANHHSPARVDEKSFGLVGATHVANVLVDEIDAPASRPGDEGGLDVAYVERLGLAARLDEWRASARQQAGPGYQGTSPATMGEGTS
jgi:HD-like signal output (HDOD) protein/CheY-like chemotaxis protein